MRSLYHSSQFRNRFNAFSRFLRSAYHDSLYPSVDGQREGTLNRHDPETGPYEICEFRGNLKICPATALVFNDNVLLKNSTDLFMRERVPNYSKIYDSPGRQIPEVISLRHGSEPNYWHFFQLIAAKAVIADLHGLPPEIPVLMSRRQCNVPFIKQALELGILGDRDLLVQEPDEVVASQRVFVIRPPLHDPAYRNMVLDRLGHAGGDRSRSHRYFVTRGKSAENDRRLQNEAAVIEALAPFGFQTLDPQTLSLDVQMATFATCGFMVSPHGAGLTNMIFRRGAPLDIVEIFNFNLVNDCYEIAAKQHDFGYRALFCDTVSGKPKSGNALVDVDELVAAVRDMLDGSPGG